VSFNLGDTGTGLLRKWDPLQAGRSGMDSQNDATPSRRLGKTDVDKEYKGCQGMNGRQSRHSAATEQLVTGCQMLRAGDKAGPLTEIQKVGMQLGRDGRGSLELDGRG
jgi:hypothetical protein